MRVLVLGCLLFLVTVLPVYVRAQEDLGLRASLLKQFVLEHDGDSHRGREIFLNDQRLGCSKCHSVDGTTQSVGPNLSTIGNKFERGDLVTSIVDPSQSIAIGYGTTIVVTKEGQAYQGVLQRVTAEWLELLDKDKKVIRVEHADVDTQKESPISLMPAGLQGNLTGPEIADLVAYLASLKQSTSVAGPAETSSVISRARAGVTLTPQFGKETFEHPIWMGQIPESSINSSPTFKYVVIEQAGRAYVVERTADDWKRVLLFDLSKSVRTGGATGLLGMAFHPQFVSNRRYFIKYQTLDGNRIQTIVEERKLLDSNDADSETSLRRLLNIPAVTQDHNGGCITFGPDGYLYVGMGDSGPQGDPQGHGQDLSTFLGKILRIDVDRDRSDGDTLYGIPADNPFIHQRAQPEIWALGFREPWRFSFDRKTKELWVGDVGQNRFEEVTIVRAGENHGWNVKEGHAEHSAEYHREDVSYVQPVFSYPRSQGVSITGGYVYRGRQAAHMDGWYICGDFESRRIWALQQQDRRLSDVVEIGRAPSRIVSFAEDNNGELYLIGYDNGVIYRMDLTGVDTQKLQVRTLSETSLAGPVLWRYTTTEPPAGWTEPGFDDSTWKTGPGGFGTNGTPGAVVRTDWNGRHIWIRREFNLPATVQSDSKLHLTIHHDEDAEVYLNGREVFKGQRWTSSYTEVPLPESINSILTPTRNVIAIHCRQTGGGQYIDAGLLEYLQP